MYDRHKTRIAKTVERDYLSDFQQKTECMIYFCTLLTGAVIVQSVVYSQRPLMARAGDE